MANRQIKPKLPDFHGFLRRGLGSNLNRLGIDDSVIQRVLHHSNISTTQSFYIKAVSGDVRDAMTKLESKIRASLRPAGSGAEEKSGFVN